jgi:signal transduction histidine kinase
VGKGLQHSSGRVIALGRLMLASLFLAGILLDASQPARAPLSTYAILGIYIAFAAGMAVATWRSWWIDARLAGPAHAIDVVAFAVLVLLTESYTSPFFTFFVFVLLSAAIRWGWRATALSAILLILLYLLVGLLGLTSGVPFQWQQFLVRTGQLVILSLILIWFGANQRWAQVELRSDKLFGQLSLDESPLEAALRAAVARVGATMGLFLWRDPGQAEFAGLSIDEKGVGAVDHALAISPSALEIGPFLYDLARDRAVTKDALGNLLYFAPSEILPLNAARKSKLQRGLSVPISAGDGDGFLFLENCSGLAIDHIDAGAQIAADIAIQRQRHALLKAAEESAEARSRLTLARDLHDSVVQFLAGAAFRLEAMKRSNASGRDVDEELNELKQLMLQEQRELRSFIKSLRSGPLAAFNDLARDLQALAAHLSRQWDVKCEFSARPANLMIPTRVRLDAHQLTREAVANAVRHAAARYVTIGLAAQPDELLLEIVNDGADFPRRNKRIELPTSLKERVEEAGGSLDMSRGMGVTKLSISLPIGEAAR